MRNLVERISVYGCLLASSLVVSSCRSWNLSRPPLPPAVPGDSQETPVTDPLEKGLQEPVDVPIKPDNSPGKNPPVLNEEGILMDYLAQRDQLDLEKIKQSLKFPSILAGKILQDFDKKAPGRPRIVANKQDFERIKQLLAMQDPYIMAGVEALRKQGDLWLEAPILKYELDAAQLRLTAPHATQDQIAGLSLLYQLTGERRYSSKVWQHLENYANFPDWNAGKHFLDTGIMSYSVALGFDWIFDTLSQEQKLKVTRALLDKGLNAGLKAMNEKKFWYLSRNNWNAICNGGLSLAALAILDLGPEARQVGSQTLEKAMAGLPYYIREFEPDGQTVEGMMYWDYGLSNFFRWSESMVRSLGTDYGYSATKGLERAGFFPLAMSGPVTGLAIGDDPLKTIRSDTNFWFAKRYRNPGLARIHIDEVNRYKKYSWFELLTYDSSLLQDSQASIKLPLDSYVRDIEYISFRSNWDHSRALYVGVHGGDNNAPHGHLDAGTFFVQGAGYVWAIGGLGNDNYTFPGYFSRSTLPGYQDPVTPVQEPGRFHMYRLRAEGKNTLVLNPDTRPDQNPLGQARVERIQSNQKDALGILDLTQVYNRDAQRVKRGIGLRNDRSVVVIQDEIKAKTFANTYWFMHTSATIEMKQAGRVALLKQGKQTLWVEIQTPSTAKFTVMEAKSLPGLNFPKSQNGVNEPDKMPLKKLVIQLNQLTEQTLTVAMTMLKLGNLEPDTPLPGPISLDNWSL